MKLICPDCGKQYESGKFCLECGAKLQEVTPELVCPSCGYKAKAGKFCPECGTKLTEQSLEPVVVENNEPEKRKFNEKDERFAKYYDKKGFPRDLPQEERAVAIEELKKYVDQNVAEAKMLLGNILCDVNDENESIKGFQLLKEAEQFGDKTAYYLMAIAYLHGIVVDKNDLETEKRLLEWYHESESEFVASILGKLYALSDEICDYQKAYEYSTLAAEADALDGYLTLGMLYQHGWGVDKNIELAIENYKMAAAQGDETAMNQIGFIYMNGEGIEENPKQAFYWFNESAQKGYVVGINNVGYCYKNGYGVDKDEEIAAEWYKKAAQLGDTDAMYELGNYYQTVLFDLDKSKAWYQKAADLGHEEAKCELQGMNGTIENVKEVKAIDTKRVSDDEWCVPDGTTILDASVFPDASKKWRNSIKSIHLPKSLKEVDIIIDDGTMDCADLYVFPNLEKVIIPNGDIERFCEMSFFVDNEWHKVWYEDGSHVCPEVLSLINNKKDSEYSTTLYSETVISHGLCSEEMLIISPRCKEISKEAFKKNNNINRVFMFDSVQNIGKETFLECVNLTDIRLSNNIRVIPKWMLQNCINLKHLVIPEGVTVIEEGAFSGCRSLETVTLPSTISRIEGGGMFGINPFSLCDSLQKIIVPKGRLKYFQGLLGSRAKYVVEA